MYKAHQKDTNWGKPSPLCEGCRLSVVGCQKSLAWHPAVFSGPFFSRPCGWTKTHRWRILYLCKIQHPTNQPVLNFPLSHLALPFWAWPKKSQPSRIRWPLPFVTAVIREDVWTCPGTDQADLGSESWYFESSDGGPDSMGTLKTFIPCTAAWSLSLAKCARKPISESQRSNEMPMNLGLELNYEAGWRSVKQVI